MSFEDIEVARAAHTAKDNVKGKGRHGRKRKRAALDKGEPYPQPDQEPEPEPEVARASKEVRKSTGKRARKHKSIALEADRPRPEPSQCQCQNWLGLSAQKHRVPPLRRCTKVQIVEDNSVYCYKTSRELLLFYSVRIRFLEVESRIRLITMQ
jgi:hypothetical protein